MMPYLFQRLDLSGDVRRTFRFHLAYAVIDGLVGGILLNAPFVAIKEIGAKDWQIPLRDGCVGFGMLASLYLGSLMAPRRKIPFVVLPCLAASLCSLLMVAALWAGSAFWFLLSMGLGGIFEIVTRPAVAAVLRRNYPVVERGQITSTVRQWSSLSFAVSIMLSAYILQLADKQAAFAAGAEIVCAMVLGLAGVVCFSRIKVRDEAGRVRQDFRLELFKNIRDAVGVVTSDGRYRRHLLGCLMEGFFGMLSLSLVAVLLSKKLGFDYMGCAALLHGLPTLVAFFATGLLGWWFDHKNPWVSWAWVRFAFSADALLLAMAPFVYGEFPAFVLLILIVAGRMVRGFVQGGWWVLWWQIGITHFAPPGEDTSRYAAVMVFLYGLVRIVASATAMVLSVLGVQPEMLLWIGGVGMLVSGLYSLWQAARERRERRPKTFAEFELQFEK